MNTCTVRHKNSSVLLLVLCTLVMQSCATNYTTTSQVPGKVLAIKSLGLRETSDKISLKEIDPYTVSVTRNLCTTEVLSVERQALLETKYGTQAFDCTDAYAEYLAHNITALGVPLLYDSVTGFKRVQEMCTKKPPVYRIVTTESNEIISEEAYDSNTTACKDLPVADALLTAKIDDSAVIYIATAADGIASLPPEKIAQLERAAANTDITYLYEEVALTTRHLRKKPEYPLLFSTAAMNDAAAGDVPQGDEASPGEISDPEIALEQSFVAAFAPPMTVPLAPPTVFQGDRPSVPVARRTASDQKMTVRSNAAGAGGESSAPVFPSAVPVPVPSGGKVAAESKAALVPDKIAAAEIPPPVPKLSTGKSVAESKIASAPENIAAVKAPSAAEVAPAASGEKSSLAALPSATTGPRHPREMILFYDPYAPAPERIAAAETPETAKIDQGSAKKTSSMQITSDGAAAPKAGKSLRDQIKSAAPAAARQKTHVHAMARATTRREELQADILLQQLFILSPSLSRICCPLTDKLFWKMGY